MKIVFLEQGGSYVAEFQVDSAFALHLEGVREDQVTLYQRSGDSSRYDTIIDFRRRPVYDDVMDYESDVLVSPKYIMIVSDVLPTYAEVISDGEVTEIKSHSKEVEIVANGTTDVTPDAGYSYLSGVSVKVNVPQEGGDTPSGGGNWKYFDISSLSTLYKAQIGAAIGLVVKHTEGGITTPAIGIINEGGNYFDEVTAVASDWDFKITGADGNAHPFGEAMESAGITLESLASMGVTEITEEEFYNTTA